MLKHYLGICFLVIIFIFTHSVYGHIIPLEVEVSVFSSAGDGSTIHHDSYYNFLFQITSHENQREVSIRSHLEDSKFSRVIACLDPATRVLFSNYSPFSRYVSFSNHILTIYFPLLNAGDKYNVLCIFDRDQRSTRQYDALTYISTIPATSPPFTFSSSSPLYYLASRVTVPRRLIPIEEKLQFRVYFQFPDHSIMSRWYYPLPSLLRNTRNHTQNDTGNATDIPPSTLTNPSTSSSTSSLPPAPTVLPCSTLPCSTLPCSTYEHVPDDDDDYDTHTVSPSPLPSPSPLDLPVDQQCYLDHRTTHIVYSIIIRTITEEIRHFLHSALDQHRSTKNKSGRGKGCSIGGGRLSAFLPSIFLRRAGVVDPRHPRVKRRISSAVGISSTGGSIMRLFANSETSTLSTPSTPSVRSTSTPSSSSTPSTPSTPSVHSTSTPSTPSSSYIRSTSTLSTPSTPSVRSTIPVVPTNSNAESQGEMGDEGNKGKNATKQTVESGVKTAVKTVELVYQISSPSGLTPPPTSASASPIQSTQSTQSTSTHPTHPQSCSPLSPLLTLSTLDSRLPGLVAHLKESLALVQSFLYLDSLSVTPTIAVLGKLHTPNKLPHTDPELIPVY